VTLDEQFGNIDIHLFDQIRRQRITPATMPSSRRCFDGSWRPLAAGGMFFCRLASTIGIESQVERIGAEGRRYRLPVVQGQRSMTTWVVRKD
jgi:hypothetical protein